jgi:uncharacterized protein (TIGR03086 family)
MGHSGSRPRRPGVTLREVINYHAYDEIWVPATLSGKTIQQVGTQYDGDLLGPDPKASFKRLTAQTIQAVEAFRDYDRIVHLTYGDYPAREYLKHITSFRGFRAYDIAKFIGANTTLPDELIEGMRREFEPEIEQWRAMGVFGPAVSVPESASAQDRLLGLVGRDPYAK